MTRETIANPLDKSIYEKEGRMVEYVRRFVHKRQNCVVSTGEFIRKVPAR